MKILFCCSGGITSSIISAKIQKIINEENKEYIIETIATTYISNHLENVDFIVLAPHVILSQNTIDEYKVPVIKIPQNIYGTMEGSLIFEYIEENINTVKLKDKSMKENRFMEILKNLTDSRILTVIMTAFMNISPLSFAGSLFTLLISLPLGSWYTNWLNTSGLYQILKLPILITSNLLSIYLVISIGYQLAKSYKKKTFTAAILSFFAFLILTPLKTNNNGSYFSIDNFGYEGLFLAILTGLLATRIYIFCLDKKLTLKTPDSLITPIKRLYDDLIPSSIVFLVFIVIRVIFQHTTYETAQDFIYGMIQSPLQNVGGGIIGITIFTFAANFLWIFGVHGSMLAYFAMMPIATTIGLENSSAFAAGTAAPHPEWLLSPWTVMGGGGSTFALCILMITRAKSQHLKQLGRFSFVTSLFQINEPLIFGIPIVLNPILALPFVVTPLINLFLSIIAMRIGFLVPPTGATINAFIPFGFYGALVNAHWSGFVWSIVILVVDICIYYPFFKMQDLKYYSKEHQ